jgi:hypothetical protein
LRRDGERGGCEGEEEAEDGTQILRQTHFIFPKAMSQASLLDLAIADKWDEMRSLLQRGSGFGDINEKDAVRF